MSAKYFYHPIHGAVLSTQSETKKMLFDGFHETPADFPEAQSFKRRDMLKESRHKGTKEIVSMMHEMGSDLTIQDCEYLLNLENESSTPRGGLIAAIKKIISSLTKKMETDDG